MESKNKKDNAKQGAQKQRSDADKGLDIQENFPSLLEKSKALKDEANQDIKNSLDRALEKYKKALKIFLDNIPKLVIQESDFILEWKMTLSSEEQKQAKELFAIIFSNCSLIYLQKDKPLMAYFYAYFSHWCNLAFLKANLRKARAMIDLLYVHEADGLLHEMKEKTNDNQLLKEIDSMLEEVPKIIAECAAPKTVIQFLTNDLTWSLEKSYQGPYKLVDLPGKGRGVCAVRDISRGETVLIDKGIVYKGKQADFCYHFLKHLDNREDLKALFLNLFICNESPESKLHEEDSKEDNNDRELLKDKSKLKWKNLTNEEIDNFLDKVQRYSFQVNENAGVFPSLGLFNHSCDPNTSLWTANDMAMMLAQRDIKKGEEICISYVGLTGGKAHRKSLLSSYRFECDCQRCKGTGGWKEKEAQLTGLRCPKCNVEVACNDEKKFKCPNGCWECGLSDYKALDEKTNEKLEDLLEWGDKNDNSKLKLAQETVKTVESQFSQYHFNRGNALRVLARFHAFRKEEKEFLQCFFEVVKIIEFFSNPDYRTMVTSMLYELCLNFGREPSTEELAPFLNFGLTLDVTKGLWKKTTGGK